MSIGSSRSNYSVMKDQPTNLYIRINNLDIYTSVFSQEIKIEGIIPNGKLVKKIN